MSATPEKIDSSLIPRVETHSQVRTIDPGKIKLNDKLQIAEGVKFMFLVIGRERAREFNSNSFEVRVFVRFPRGRTVTIIEERLFINVADCGDKSTFVAWCCATKTQPQLESLSDFITQYLGIEIREAENSCAGFRVFVEIPQHAEDVLNFGIEIIKPKQNISGLFV